MNRLYCRLRQSAPSPAIISRDGDCSQRLVGRRWKTARPQASRHLPNQLQNVLGVHLVQYFSTTSNCRENRSTSLDFNQFRQYSTASNGEHNGSSVDLDSKSVANIASLELRIEAEMTRLGQSEQGRGGERLNETVDRVVDLYNQWWDAHHSPTTISDNEKPPLSRRPEDNKVFRSVLEACSVYEPRGSQALHVMDHWGEAFGKVFEYAPQRRDFDLLLLAYANQKTRGEGNPAGEAIDVIDLLEDWSFTMKPLLVTYLLAVRCISQGILAATSLPEHGLKVKEYITYLQGLLEKIEPLLVEDMETNDAVLTFQSCGEAVCAIMSAKEQYDVKSQDQQSVISRAEWLSNHWLGLLDQYDLQESCSARNVEFEDTVDATVEAVLKLYAQFRNPSECADLTFALIQRMEAMSGDLLPSNAHYYSLIKAWNSAPELQQSEAVDMRSLVQGLSQRHFSRIHLFDPEKASRERDFLMKSFMEVNQYALACDIYEKMASDPTINQSEESLSLYLEALLRIGTPEATLNADGVLRRMASSGQPLLPAHFEMLLYSWARSRHKDYLARCNDLFALMQRLSKSNSNLTPGQAHYNAIIEALALDAKQNKSKKAVYNISKIINEMEGKNLRPNAKSYMALLGALPYANSPGAPQAADKILGVLETNYPDDVSADAYAKAISLWSTSGLPQAAEHCELILAKNKETFAKSNSKPSLLPTCEAYRGLITAVVRTDSPEAATRPEVILEQMEKDAAAGLCEPPDEFTYTSVMNAYSKSTDSHETVGRILQRMESAYRNGQATARPNTSTFNTFLDSIWRSNVRDKAWTAYEIYQTMRDRFQKGDLSVRPDIYTTAAVLNACVHTHNVDEKARAELVTMALSILQDGKGQVDRRGRPMLDDKCYQAVLRIIHQDVLDPEEGERLAVQVFEQCCHAGMVGKGVLYQIREGFRGLHVQLPRDSTGHVALRKQWTINVPKRKSKLQNRKKALGGKRKTTSTS